MANDTYSGNRHIYVGIEQIIGHIYLDFMEIFQDWALPNLEYHLFQVIGVFQY